MVNFLNDLESKNQSDFKKDITDVPEEELNWSNVSISEIINNNRRFEASFYDLEGRHAREVIKRSKWDTINLWSENGLIEKAFYPSRFKRIYVDKSDGIPFFTPSQMLDINPRPYKYISEKTRCDFSELALNKNNILLTRSGSTGYCTLVNETLKDKIFSDDVIRISCKNYNDIGYVYAFLSTKIGSKLVKTNDYGAVISHIEPEHLKDILIPNPPEHLKKQVNELIMESFSLRDESNKLREEAKSLLIDELDLPNVNCLNTDNFDDDLEFDNYTVKLSNLNSRLDGSFHDPKAKAIIKHLKKHSKEIINLGDSEITKDIILPSRFSRVYVDEGQGTKFLGGKDIFQLNPATDKFLSIKHHKERIEQQLEIKRNSIITPSRGTLGDFVLTSKQFEGWTISDNLIQIVSSNPKIIGYFYIFLSTEYGKILTKRFIYGSVVDALEVDHISNIEIPLLENKNLENKINNIALEANDKIYQAYKLEQKALSIVNNKILGLSPLN